MEPVTLRTARLVLDSPQPGDADLVTEYCQDARFQRYMVTPWPYRRAHAETFLGDLVPAGWRWGRELTWAIRDLEGGALLGVVGVRLVNLPLGVRADAWAEHPMTEPRRADVGYWLGFPARGRGVMPEAVAAVLDWIFASGYAGIEEVEWEAIIGNTASARVAHKVGFRFDGVRPARVHRPEELVDGVAPDAWHALLGRDDDRTASDDGWPAAALSADRAERFAAPDAATERTGGGDA